MDAGLSRIDGGTRPNMKRSDHAAPARIAPAGCSSEKVEAQAATPLGPNCDLPAFVPPQTDSETLRKRRLLP